MRRVIFFPLALASLVAGVSGLSLWRAKTLMERELGALTPQMDVLTAEWETKNVPAALRVVTILLSDTRAVFDPFLLTRESENADSAGDWLGRNLIGGNAVASVTTPLNRAFSDSTQLTGWTHSGYSKIGEEAMAREVEKAIRKAQAAGARVAIVAQGTDAGAVLNALARVQGAAVAKVVLLGVNAGRVKRGKPASVGELAYVWSTREVGASIQIQIYGGSRDGETINLEAAWPGLSSGGDSVDKSLRLIRGFVEATETLDQLIARQEASAKAEREKQAGMAQERVEAERAKAAPAVAVEARPVATVAAAPAKAVVRAGSGPIASQGNWSAGRLYDYSQTMDGTPIGWQFSAPPGDDGEGLSREHSARLLKRPKGLTSDDCYQYLDLRAVSVKKLGPGERDAAMIRLYERENNVSDQNAQPMQRVSTKVVHGRPAGLFRRVKGDGSRREQTSLLIVDTGRHLIYLNLNSMYRPAVEDACMDPALKVFQGIAESLRPAGD